MMNQAPRVGWRSAVQRAAGRAAACDRAAVDSDHGITSRILLGTNASSAPPRSATAPLHSVIVLPL